MDILYKNLLAFTWQDLVMIAIGCLLVYLAIKKEMEPSLLLPMGFGTILVNIPFSDALHGPIQELYNAGIANELFPTGSAVRESVKINGDKYTVVGVLEAKQEGEEGSCRGS